MRLIGVDPGTQVLGWGVIDVEGRKLTLVGRGALEALGRTKSGKGAKGAKSVAERLAAIGDAFAEVVREQKPDLAAVERAFFGKSATAALRVGEARGVALAELARAGVPVEELAPSEVKRAVTGTGGARKGQVQLMVGAILGVDLAGEPFDSSDALALAVCLAHRIAAGEPPRPGGSGRARPGRARRKSARAPGKSRRKQRR